jgi:tRNA (guanine-N7-)-methyltransferase
MSRKKLPRFEHNAAANNVIERGKELYTTIKGKWREKYFKNNNPIVLELACGKGEYTVGLGEANPDKNYIGIDIKGDRIARGSKRAIEKGLTNVAFLRTPIQFLEEFFELGEVDEIWIIHPDPQPRDKEEKKRLTYINYLNLYKKLIKINNLLCLKTDNFPFYEYSLDTLSNNGFKILEKTDDLYNSELNKLHFDKENQYIETYYEKKFVEMGYKINFLIAKLIE